MDNSKLLSLLSLGITFFVVIPMWNGLRAWLEEKKVRANAPRIPIGYETCSKDYTEEHISEVDEWWKRNNMAFVTIEGHEGIQHYYRIENLETRIRSAILAGDHKPSSPAQLHKKGEDGTWSKAIDPLSKLIDSMYSLRVLYRPVWATAMAGLKWGALAGVALKLIDTAIGIAIFDPGAAFCFVFAIAFSFIPRIGVIGIVVISLVLSQIYEANFFMIGISSALTGAILGCLPGMAIGGFIGLSRRTKLELAPGAINEGPWIILKSTVLPLAGGVALAALYIFAFHPWLLSILEG